MKTITSKRAINGAQLWYVDGKRTSRDKAAEAAQTNGRETLSNLVAGLTSDDNQNFGIVAVMNDTFGNRYINHYTEYFYFATAENAVTAAKKIVALGKQVYRLTIDNSRPYPSNIRYADTVRGKLIFLNGFERFNEGDEEKPATVEVSEKPATVNEPDAQTETAKFEVGKTYAAKKTVLFDSQINMTVLKRTNCYVTFQFDDDEDDIRKCKVTCEYGVEKIYLHENNAIGDDYEFSAKDVIADTDEVTETETDGHIDGFDESAFDALPNFDDEEDDDELIDPPETTAEDKQLLEVKPEFKRYDSFKVKAAHMDTTIKPVSFGGITNHSRDKPTSRKEVTSMSEFDEACWQIWQRHGHKHRWFTETDKYGSPTAYFVDEDGNKYYADGSDSEWFDEIREQLGLIYADKRDYTGVSESGWYDEDDPRLKDDYNESYSWREVESDYYRDVL